MEFAVDELLGGFFCDVELHCALEMGDYSEEISDLVAVLVEEGGDLSGVVVNSPLVDDGLDVVLTMELLISLRCRNLTRLKLRSCRQITDAGVATFIANGKSLKKLSCSSCAFGATGLNAVLDGCSTLEELSIKRLKGLADDSASQPINLGNASASLKSICLKELYND
ncbi:hypothetical protein AAC387_Pa07g2117 [Persea americana]